MTEVVLRRPYALVLHDDRLMASHIRDLLTAQSYDVDLVDGPLQMLGAAGGPESGLPTPALIVIAAGALDRRDRDLVPILRESAPGATILVLFHPHLRDAAAQMLAAGADATLQEPFYPGEFSAYARRAANSIAPRSVEPRPAEPDRDASPPPADQHATPVQQIAVGVAHAVRNPLQIMELMLAGAEAGDELDIDELRGLMKRIADVAADLARFSDHTRSTPTVVELGPLVDEVFGAVPKKAAPNVLVDVPKTSISVTAETELLRSALEVLRDRALRETPRDGAIRVEVTVAGGWASVAVTDQGQSLDETQLRHFFEPDPDMNVVQAGTWLEMAALEGMIRAQGGSVSVAPGTENGVTVTFRLATDRGAGDDA